MSVRIEDGWVGRPGLRGAHIAGSERVGNARQVPLWAHGCQLAGRRPVGVWTFASGGSQHPERILERDGHRWSRPGQGGRAMKRVVVDRFGGPEVLKVVEDEDPRPGPGEVRVKVLAAGVSFTDSQLRAGTYIPGGPKPPFTPGYELVGVVEELGPGCSRLREGDRIGALTVWGADAERVCVPEASAVEVPEDLDPAEVLSLVFTVHDRLPGASPHGEGEERGDGARARRGRQGRHRGPRARSAGRASPLRDRFGARPRRGRAARRGGDRLSERGLPGAGARAARDKAWTSCSTRSVARCRFAPSARCGPAEGSSCSAATPRSRTGTRTGRR